MNILCVVPSHEEVPDDDDILGIRIQLRRLAEEKDTLLRERLSLEEFDEWTDDMYVPDESISRREELTKEIRAVEARISRLRLQISERQRAIRHPESASCNTKP